MGKTDSPAKKGSLQARMFRQARAVLDPILNLGLLQPEQAKRFLMDQVVLSEPRAKQEVDRHTFRRPACCRSICWSKLS